MKIALSAGLILLAITLAACAARLATRSPASVDLSGTWVLNQALSQDVTLQRSKRAPERRTDGGQGRSAGNRNSQELVYASPSAPQKRPYMSAIEMTIEQGPDSMGVAYPNARYRDVDWGKRVVRGTKINAGWEQSELVINSDSKRLEVKEVYRLDISGNLLTLTIAVKGRGGTKEFVRVFDSQTSSHAAQESEAP
jgi:hypothetical protein